MHSKERFTPLPKKMNCLPENREKSTSTVVGSGRFPSWLHLSLPKATESSTNRVLQKNRLYTVCEEARCPNLPKCFSRQTATFLAMGRECTRSCGFCSIDFSKAPPPLLEDEPDRIARSALALNLKHVVITMVARDDIQDGGAMHLCKIVAAIRQQIPHATVELLTSDFTGRRESWQTVVESKPEIFNHNIETVRDLTPKVRHRADYERTLKLLAFARKALPKSYIKSGIMVGLGETEKQVEKTLDDLHRAGCDIVTIGHYLQADRNKLRLQSFVTPQQFAHYEAFGKSIGIKLMYCAPFVRSSYNADLLIEQVRRGGE